MIFFYSRYYHWYVGALWALVACLLGFSGATAFALRFSVAPEVCRLPVVATSCNEPITSVVPAMVDWQGVIARCAERAHCAVMRRRSWWIISGTAAQIAHFSCLVCLYNFSCTSFMLKPKPGCAGRYEWWVALC